MRHPASNPFSREPYTFVSRFPQVDADELHATRKALDCALVRYQDDEIQADSFVDKTNILYWSFLRNNVQPAEFSIILNLASRHSLTWTNEFIESLVDFDDGTKTFVINTKRLETLIFLQEHCGLQGRDLSDSKSPYIIKNNDVYLLEKRIEEDSFDDERIDEANEFLNRFKDKDTEAINWIKFLVKQKFLNFAVLCKKYHLENSELILWLEQWADQCGVKQKMKEAGSLNLDFIPSDTLNQRTLRNIVRYGLSPHWLRTVSTSASQSVLEDAIQQEIIPDNADFRSALEYHQGQNIIFADRYEHSKFFRAITEQPVIEDDAESHADEHDNHPWIQTYTTKPEDLYTLRQLSEVLSLERLKFYHDYHRLPALIQQVQEGKLSLAEVEEYDSLDYEKQETAISNHYAAFTSRNPILDNIGQVTSRKLPRLLAGAIAADSSAFKLSEIAHYDMFDYNPKNNPTRSIKFPGKPNLQKAFDVHEKYLDDLFNTVFIPLAKERARLYQDWYLLNKKVIANPESEHSAGFFGCLCRTPHDEMKLLQEKIALFSGMLKDQCINLKYLEMVVAGSKRDGKLPPNDIFIPDRLFHYKLHYYDDYNHRELRSRSDSLYHQELRGMVSAADLNTVPIKRSAHDFRNVTREARDYVYSFIKRVIGDFLMIPALIVTIIASPLNINPPLLHRFCGTFFAPKSHYTTFKSTEIARKLNMERKINEEKVHSNAEKEANKDLGFMITSRLAI